MEKEQVLTLMSILEDLVSKSFDEDTLKHYDQYIAIRDALRTGGVENLRDILDQLLETEKLFGYDNNTDYAALYNILFGDIKGIPPMLERFPRLCMWRLAAAPQN